MDIAEIEGIALLVIIFLPLIIYVSLPNKHEKKLIAQGIRPKDVFDLLADLKDHIISAAKKIYRNHIKGKKNFR